MAASLTRSVLLMVTSIPLAIIAFIIGWLSRDWKVGLIAALCTIGLFMLFAIINVFFIRELGWLDVFLPIPIGIVWAAFMWPIKTILSLGTEIFSGPALVGAGFVLTLALWMSKVKNIPLRSALVVFPALVFIYEAIPVNIPGPVDDYFAFGGAVTTTIFAGAKVMFANEKVAHAIEGDETKSITEK